MEPEKYPLGKGGNIYKKSPIFGELPAVGWWAWAVFFLQRIFWTLKKTFRKQLEEYEGITNMDPENRPPQ